MKFFLKVIFCFFLSQVVQGQDFQLQNGDLLFQDLNCGAMCEAIESVTQGYDDANFSHVGIAVEIVGEFYVLEAISAGVVLSPITKFLDRSVDKNNKPSVMLARLKTEHQALIAPAIHRGLSFLGKAYDGVFDINNDKYYCSELVYEAFKEEENSIFKLYPMTFKPLASKTFFPVWVSYYQDLGIPIPEGEAGLNPGGISRSPYLDIIHWYGTVSRKSAN